MLRCVVEQPNLSSLVVILLLYKLISECSTADASVKLAMLHVFPSMTGDKGRISLIMKLVNYVTSKSGMDPLGLILLAKLWTIESRCYPFLKNALIEPTSWFGIPDDPAAVIRNIVSTHTAQYGSDLLANFPNFKQDRVKLIVF